MSQIPLTISLAISHILHCIMAFCCENGSLCLVCVLGIMLGTYMACVFTYEACNFFGCFLCNTTLYWPFCCVNGGFWVACLVRAQIPLLRVVSIRAYIGTYLEPVRRRVSVPV